MKHGPSVFQMLNDYIIKDLEDEVLSSEVDLIRYYSSFSLRAMHVMSCVLYIIFVNKPSTCFYFK